MAKEVVESELRLKADSVISEMNKVTVATSAFSKQLQDVLNYLDLINKKSLSNINKQINKNSQTVKYNIEDQYVDSYYDMGSKKRIAKSSSGALMTSDTGREKIFREYEEAIVAETEAIKKDVDERRRRRKQRADAETQSAKNGAVRAAKMEDKTSQTYLDNQSKIAEAKLINAKANQIGAYLRDPRYQAGRALGVLGTKVSTIGVGSDKIEGRIVGDILNTIGMSLKSPIAGTMTGLSSLANGIIDLGKAATQAFAEIDSIKTQLGVVFSNQTQADTMFGQISQYAVKSPFGVQQTSELAVLLKQSGVYASDLMDTLKMLGDTASGNMEKMKRIANNYAQIVSIGKASMLDMRQFAYAGIPIFEAVSKELGVSQEELRKLISDGKVTSDIIEKVFKDLTGINGIFENATEKGAKTLKARLQNLSDAKQLAMASAGEWLTSYGTQTGNDSFVNGIVSELEQLYQYIHESVDTRNIEKSVKAIEERELRIGELTKYQEKYANNPKMYAIMSRALGVELSKRDKDSERAIYEASYQNKNQVIKDTYKDFGVNNFSELKELAHLIDSNTKLQYLSFDAKKLNPVMGAGKAVLNQQGEKYGIDLSELYLNMPKDEFNALEDALREAVQAVEKATKVTELEAKYHIETNAIQAQQLAFDQENKRSGRSNSLNSKFQELLEIYKDSDEYKQKEEEKRIAALTEAKELLKELRAKSDDTGSVDFTKYSMADFLKFDSQGAFSASRKLNVVNGNNPPDPEDVKLLRKQFNHAMIEAVKGASSVSDSRTANQLQNELSQLNKNLDDTDYLDKFSSTLESVKAILSGSQLPSQLKSQLLSFINSSTLFHELVVGGENADLTDVKKGKEKPDYIPLWKRIIEGATGFSAERISKSTDFMDEYQKYAAMQVSRSGLQGLVNAGGRNGEIDALMAYSDKTNKQGVKQIDWLKTEENLYKYALSMETPLKKASATMSGLADGLKSQVETYRKLTVDMRTVGEDWTTINNDIKGQYSVAQGLGNANILDNAFQATAGETKRFKVQFDEKQGLVVFDKISNSIVGAVDELKNQDVKDQELADYLKNNVNIDNLVLALDRAATATEKNAAITELNANMLSYANEMEQNRLNNAAEIYGGSALLLANLKKNPKLTGTENLISKDDGSVGYEAGKLVNETFTKLIKKLIETDTKSLLGDSEVTDLLGKDGETIDNFKNTLKALDITDFNLENFEELIISLSSTFPEAIQRIINTANSTASKSQTDNLTSLADKTLRSVPLSVQGAYSGTRLAIGKNNIFEHSVMSSLGSPNTAFSDYSKTLTASILGNPSENQEMIDLYTERFKKAIKEMNASRKEGAKKTEDEIESYGNSIKTMLETGNKEGVIAQLENAGLSADVWDSATQSANKFALSLGRIGTSLKQISDNSKEMLENFASSLVSSTFETWGESLAKGADASDEMGKNLVAMSADLMKNLGAMVTQAGLSLAISSIGDKAGVMAGLAIAAAGGSMSFIGGLLSGANEDKDKSDNEYQKLLKIKQDLSDLLKQAREDAIYYENTVRHSKAISANEYMTKSVHDAIISPKGDVITTDPKDYLIATKTPKSLIGSGAPTINFSVIDKSTGIKVTQQKSTYNQSTNSIDFEAVIESKVVEVIASSKGDDAFSAREARLRGRSVIA